MAVDLGCIAAVLRPPKFIALDDIGQRAILRQDGEAHIRQPLRKMGVEAIPLRHDAPALALPEVGVDFQPIAHPDLPLLEALAHAITGLSADIVGQALQLQRRQFSPYFALRHAPELAVPHLGGEPIGLHLLIHAVRPVKVSHQAALRLLRALVLQPPAFALQGVDDLGGVLRGLPGVHRDVLLRIVLIVVGRRHGHIQLEGLEGRRGHREGVLPDHQAQSAPVVPGHVEGTQVIDVLERTHGTRLDGAGIVRAHLPEFDPAAHGVLLPQKVQPFFLDAHAFHPFLS